MDTDFKQNCHSFSLREEGALLVRAHFRYPTSSQWELYRELAENAEHWLRSTLATKAAEEYRNDPSPKKHFFFPAYEYRFEVREISKNDNEIVFSLAASLTRPKNKELLFQKELTDRFRLPDFTLLPKPRKKRKKRLR